MSDVRDNTSESTTNGPVDVLVVGGGIAGLCAAVTAAKGGASVLVLDGHPMGGRARTTEREGFSYNVGPHALYAGGALRAFLDGQHIAVAGGRPPSTSIDLLRDGSIHRVSFTATGLPRAKAFTGKGRIRLMAFFAKLPRIKAEQFAGRSVADWLADEPLQVRQVVENFIRVSTYVNAPESFDAGAAIGQFQSALAAGVDYLDGGWQTIVDGLVGTALGAGATVESGVAVEAVESDGERFVVRAGDRAFTTRTVVIASGGPEVASRLTGVDVRDAGNLTPPVTAATLDLAVSAPHPNLAFGLDRPLYLSPHAPAGRLAPDGQGLVTVMQYGIPGEPTGDHAATKAELRAFAGLVGISDDVIVHDRYLHQSIVTHGAPTAAGGGLRGRPAIDALGIVGLTIAGDWVGATGQLADASAASGQAAARAALTHLARVSV